MLHPFSYGSFSLQDITLAVCLASNDYKHETEVLVMTTPTGALPAVVLAFVFGMLQQRNVMTASVCTFFLVLLVVGCSSCCYRAEQESENMATILSF
jgi:uncharacterized membrane protein YhhN